MLLYGGLAECARRDCASPQPFLSEDVLFYEYSENRLEQIKEKDDEKAIDAQYQQ